MKKIRGLLADDHEVLLDGLVALIAHQSDIEVVVVAGSNRAAVRLAQEMEPDVVVMDVTI